MSLNSHPNASGSGPRTQEDPIPKSWQSEPAIHEVHSGTDATQDESSQALKQTDSVTSTTDENRTGLRHSVGESLKTNKPVQKVKQLGLEAKAKAKGFLRKHRLSPEEIEAEDDDGYENPYAEMEDDPAFDPAQLVGQQRLTFEGTADKTVSGIVTGVKAVLHPQNAVKGKAASKVAVQDRPYLSEKADLEFLQAHDNLNKAESDDNNGPGCGDRVEQERERVRTLERLRESRKVAWTTSRHVKRVLVVPKRNLPPPRKEDFYVLDERTHQRKLDWRAWLSARNTSALQSFAINNMGHVDFAADTPFDKEVMIRQVERILIASSPWQSFFSSLRQLYLWEDPARTKKWFFIWFVVWYFNYVMVFALSYIAFAVLENRFRSKSVNELRESYDRALQRGSAAYRFNELISQHGEDKWLDPAAQEIGPLIQLQVTDIADFLETLNNFYDWRIPGKTWATLFWVLCAVLIGALTPTEYTLKIVFMYCIIMFFLSFPVASRTPEYRHVVNALRWIFWDIPNDAEWSMIYLRRKAQETRARLIERQVHKRYDEDIADSTAISHASSPGRPEAAIMEPDEESDVDDYVDDGVSDAETFATAASSTSILGGLEIMTFKCHNHATRGRLVVFADGFRYEIHGKEKWHRSWLDLVEIRKVNFSHAAGFATFRGLVFIFTDGIEEKIESVRRRDRAFNCLIGFSGLRFQVLQPVTKGDARTKVPDVVDLNAPGITQQSRR